MAKKKATPKKRILLPHPGKKSRDAKKGDEGIINARAKDLFRICFEKIGVHNGAVAMAHPQIEGNDPIRFFVKRDGTIVVNPVISRPRQKYTHSEGCMSFPDKKASPVERFNMIDVSYVEGRVGEPINLENVVEKTNVSGLEAAIFQHEIGHFDLSLIH